MDGNVPSNENDVYFDSPPETVAVANDNLLPTKSKSQYERTYNYFMEWCKTNHTSSLSENVLLAYFVKLSKQMKPSSLWSIYSMLKMTIGIKNNVDISKYSKLFAFLKRISHGYKPKKSKILTPQQIKEFLSTAPDQKYLFTKVALIFGQMGACRRDELMKIETTDIEDLGTALLVHIRNTQNKTERQFVISGNFYNICKKYMELRPVNLVNMPRFFLNYQRGKCTKQPVGINKFGNLPSQIAKFLKLPDPTSYTGHCLRQSSATILVDSGADITTLKLKRRRGWRSTSIAEECTDYSLNNKLQTSNEDVQLVENIKIENEITNEDNTVKNENEIENGVKTIKIEKEDNTTSASSSVYPETPHSPNVNLADISESVVINVSESGAVDLSESDFVTVEESAKSPRTTQICSNSDGKSLISFTNCQNLSNFTINVYLKK